LLNKPMNEYYPCSTISNMDI